MITKKGINRLSRALHELYDKLCDMDLHKRISLYHRNTGTNAAPDIRDSLIKHIDKLAPVSKPSGANADNATTAKFSKRPGKQQNAKPRSRQHGWLNKVVSGFNRPPKKIYKSKIASDPYMGEKLKNSTWSHIHTAMLQVRQGDTSNAKMHAGFANEALKEAAHYMSEEDYRVFCEEVEKAFKDLEG